MIGKISGRVDSRAADHVLIDVGGIGYIVFASDRTLSGLVEGEFTALYTDLLVREDLLQLYGFLSPLEKEWHKTLMTVQGVGAKAALAIQGTLGTDALARAIALGDAVAVKAAPGVGPKLAQRIISELKDKAPVLGMSHAVSLSEIDTSAAVMAGPGAEAVSALVNLGYPLADANSAVASIAGEGDDVGQIIKAALKALGPKV
ncbi:MAG: Holliday junction branch migration protein RuvA [Pseudomonadota bacterium]